MTGGEEGGIDWDFCLYAAVTILHWSMAEFWAATPALLNGQLRTHNRLRSGRKGKKNRQVKKVQYADEAGW